MPHMCNYMRIYANHAKMQIFSQYSPVLGFYYIKIRLVLRVSWAKLGANAIKVIDVQTAACVIDYELLYCQYFCRIGCIKNMDLWKCSKQQRFIAWVSMEDFLSNLEIKLKKLTCNV